eukprot:TRINITY_DN5677_c0_g1_i2.p1 TRINITY_DN5677_c0_g1~~TRINITY_DN5677_c0_g1_i2.p1  ORF type:complete len:337 (+),score=36.95 TRINITY_DN5677_c0_g1_i2:62-1012(+)
MGACAGKQSTHLVPFSLADAKEMQFAVQCALAKGFLQSDIDAIIRRPSSGSKELREELDNATTYAYQNPDVLQQWSASQVPVKPPAPQVKQAAVTPKPTQTAKQGKKKPQPFTSLLFKSTAKAPATPACPFCKKVLIGKRTQGHTAARYAQPTSGVPADLDAASSCLKSQVLQVLMSKGYTRKQVTQALHTAQGRQDIVTEALSLVRSAVPAYQSAGGPLVLPANVSTKPATSHRTPVPSHLSNIGTASGTASGTGSGRGSGTRPKQVAGQYCKFANATAEQRERAIRVAIAQGVPYLCDSHSDVLHFGVVDSKRD